MNKNLVKELREKALLDESYCLDICDEAADEIERLRADFNDCNQVRARWKAEAERLRAFALWCISDKFDSRDLNWQAHVAIAGGNEQHMVGKYVADYSPLTTEEIQAAQKEVDELVARSKPATEQSPRREAIGEMVAEAQKLKLP